MCNNPNLELVYINAHTKFGKILPVLKIWSGNEIMNEILTLIKRHNSYTSGW